MAQEKLYKEQIHHRTKELPIALHQLEYPEETDTLFYLHWHQEFEILVMTRGSSEFTIEDRTYELKTGDCVFINSNFYHSAKAFEGKGCSFFALDFSYEFLQENLHTHFARTYIRPILNGSLLFPEIIHFKERSLTDWESQIITLLKEINEVENLTADELMMKIKIYQIWELLYRHAVPKNHSSYNSKEKDRLLPVLDYIKKNYSYDIALSDLSHILPMSEGQFCRIFKEAMNVTPFQYLMRYRIMQSCHLLIETDKKIGEIANLSGFNNISYYNRVFIKVIHCTPKQYRLSYKDKNYMTIPPST